MSGVRPLSANIGMARALAKRQLSELLAVLATRVEADAGCGQASRLRHAEQALIHNRFEIVGEIAREIEHALNRRRDEAEVEASLADQARLADARGVETVRTAKGPATRDGFLWLAKKRRLTAPRFEAGMRFGQLYARARSDGLKSCINDEAGGGGGEPDSPLQARVRAAAALAGLRQHAARAVGGEAGGRLFGLLEAVCGRGDTLRELAGGDDRRAAVTESELMTALDMAAVRFGMVRA